MESPDTRLLEAAYAGDAEAAAAALADGADPEAEAHGTSALYRAAFYGHPEVVRLLLEAGADPDRGDETPLLGAAHQRHARVAAMLAPLTRDPVPALRRACWQGDAAVLSALLEAGARPERHLDFTSACGHGHLEVVRLLLDVGVADIDALNSYGETGLMAAAEGGQTEVLRLLLNRGADVGISDEHGRTALDLACDGETEALLLAHLGRRDPHLACPTCRPFRRETEVLEGRALPFEPARGGLRCPQCGTRYTLGPEQRDYRMGAGGDGVHVTFRMLRRGKASG